MLSAEMEFSLRGKVHEGKSYREGGENWQFCIMWGRKYFTGRGALKDIFI